MKGNLTSLRVWPGLLSILILFGASVFLTSWLVRAQQAVPDVLQPQVRDTNVMRYKLDLAKGVLESIATEKFSLLRTNATELSLLPRQVSWRIRHTPEYKRLTADFVRASEALAKAAKSKNVDSATVAYFQLTLSCVNCHQTLRREDGLALPPAVQPNR